MAEQESAERGRDRPSGRAGETARERERELGTGEDERDRAGELPRENPRERDVDVRTNAPGEPGRDRPDEEEEDPGFPVPDRDPSKRMPQYSDPPPKPDIHGGAE